MKTETMVLLITNFIEVLILYHLTNFFFNQNVENMKLVKAALSFRYVITFVVTNYFAFSYLNISVSLITLFLITAGYRGSISKKIMITVIIHILMLLSELIVLWVLQLNGFDLLKKTEDFSIMSFILNQILFFFIAFMILKFKNPPVMMKIPKFYITLIIIFMIFLYGFILYNFREDFQSSLLFVSVPEIIGTAFVIICLYDFLEAFYQKRNFIKSEKSKIKSYNTRIKEMEKHLEELRIFRHDTKNRMLVIHQLAKKKQNENIEEYTASMIEKLDYLTKYSETGNDLVDDLINYKLSIAQKKGIKIDVRIELPYKMTITEDDFVIIMSNLLDNAIEASEKVKKDKFIKLIIKYEKGCIFICIRNRYAGKILLEDENIVTSKRDNQHHGFGLKSVKETVEKYQGIAEIIYEEDIFSVDIFIYIS